MQRCLHQAKAHSLIPRADFEDKCAEIDDFRADQMSRFSDQSH